MWCSARQRASDPAEGPFGPFVPCAGPPGPVSPIVLAPQRKAWLFLGLLAACAEEYRSPGVLTDDAVVMGISLSVIEDGPHAGELGPLPSDRPRAEVLPGDTVELDALVANVDGVLALDDAAWVLCGDLNGEGCLSSLRRQGEHGGGLPPCREDSAAHSYACLAGRGDRPQLVMPEVATDPRAPSLESLRLFARVGVIVARPGGPTTDECLRQLVLGPRDDLWGCGIGARDVPYGPDFRLSEMLGELGIPVEHEVLPPVVARFLPPNAALQIEEVLVGDFDDPRIGGFYSVDEVIEVAVDSIVVLAPVVSVRDQQFVLLNTGPDSWVGVPEFVAYNVWSDREPGGVPTFGYGGFVDDTRLHMPSDPGPMRLYFTVIDSRQAISWFTLDLQVVAR